MNVNYEHYVHVRGTYFSHHTCTYVYLTSDVFLLPIFTQSMTQTLHQTTVLLATIPAHL